MNCQRNVSLLAVLLLCSCHSPQPATPPTPTQESGKFSELRFPFIEVPEDRSALKHLQDDPISAQPWLSGSRRPPESLKDLGLSGELHLVLFRRTQLDPAFPVVLADAKGRLFAFCATSETDYSGYGDTFLLGAIRPSPTLERVLPGSASYYFLFSLVWSFAKDARYQPDAAILKDAQSRLRLSDEEFRELISEPKWSRNPTNRHR